MWERAGARLERLGREGTGEGKDPRRGCCQGHGCVCGQFPLLPWLVGSGIWRDPLPCLGAAWGPGGGLSLSWQARQTPPTLNSLSHLPCPPCASHVGALGWTSCSPSSSSRAETPVLLIMVGEKSRQSPLGWVGGHSKR